MKRFVLALLIAAVPSFAQNPGRGALSRGAADLLYCPLATGCPGFAGTVTSVGNGAIGSLFSASWATSTTTPALSFNFAAFAANSVLSNATAGAAVPTAFAMPSCSSSSSALIWTTSTGFGCNTAVAAATVTTNANLTGPITSVGNATSIASQTGTGTKFVVDTSPTIIGLPLVQNTAAAATLRFLNTSATGGGYLNGSTGIMQICMNRNFAGTPDDNTRASSCINLNAAASNSSLTFFTGTGNDGTVAQALGLDKNQNATLTAQTILDGTAQSLAAYTTAGAQLSIRARSITDTSSSGTVAVNAVHSSAAPTLLASSATTYTDSNEWLLTGPPVASTNVTQTRPHTLAVVDATSAASSITGGLVVATTLGTTATSVGIGGGNINAGGNGTFGGTLGVTGIPTFTATPILSAQAVTAGTMTVTNSANVRVAIHRFDWTNAMVTALGATTAGDIAVCTLPAKTVVRNVYVVIDTPDSSANALSVAVGRTAAAYIDYIVASDAKGAANTIYGDASAERGTNLTGYDLPSVTGTTVVNAHFIKTTSNLSTVTASTGHIYIETEILP